MLPPMYNNNMEIVQSPGYVAILNEMYHDARIIPLDGRPHIPQNIRQWRGDSRGHWEGNTWWWIPPTSPPKPPSMALRRIFTSWSASNTV